MEYDSAGKRGESLVHVSWVDLPTSTFRGRSHDVKREHCEPTEGWFWSRPHGKEMHQSSGPPGSGALAKVPRDVLGVVGIFMYCGYGNILLTFVKTQTVDSKNGKQ